MADTYASNYLASLGTSLSGTEATLADGRPLADGAAWLDESNRMTARLAKSGGRIFFVGNGASAAMADHMALDWSKNGGVSAYSFSSSATLTAVGNDLGIEQLFAAPLKWYAKPGDLLVAISSSGNSPNVRSAVGVARELGMSVMTLTGLNPENPLRQTGDLNLFVNARTYGIVECSHQVLLHMWLDEYMKIEEWAKTQSQDMRVGSFRL